MAARKRIVRTAGPEIDWSEFTPDHENYYTCLRVVGDWLRAEWVGDNGTKKAKEEVVFWLTNADQLENADAIKEVESWRFHYHGQFYYMMNNGAILSDHTLSWIEDKMAPIFKMGHKLLVQSKKNFQTEVNTTSPDPKIVELRAGRALASNLEDLILTGEFGNEMNVAFDVLQSHSPKPGVLKAAIVKLKEYVDELDSFTPDEIKEGYTTREDYDESRIAYSELLRVATTFTENAKTRRKATRKRKTSRFSKEGKAVIDVAKVNVMAEYPDLNLVGIPLEKMVGARGVMVYNTKDRKLGIYRAKDDKGIQVTGTTIKNFDEAESGQKTLRKPKVQIESLRRVTLKRAEIVMRDNINSKMAKITGRLNKHVIIIAAWK